MPAPNADPPAAEHLPLGFPEFPGSYALLSESPDTNAAVLFVHGFWGDAVDTWQEFQRLVDGPAHARHFARADLFFYAYPSVRHTLKVATEHFENFVDRMLTGPWEAAVDPRTGASFPVDAPNQPYDLLLLVGHSLGGVIVRNAIAKAANRMPSRPATWPLLLGRPPQLFAPAHSGFRHDDLVSLVVGLSRIAAFTFVYWRVRHAKAYEELKSHSKPLEHIESETLRARGQYGDCPALYADILWGEDENVVVDVDYEKDRTPDSVPGKNHQTICKPADGFNDPVTMVIHGLE
jgi:pimeloyl-ACP methyl ester carboxylesterase